MSKGNKEKNQRIHSRGLVSLMGYNGLTRCKMLFYTKCSILAIMTEPMEVTNN